MTHCYYILEADGRTPRPVDDVLIWGAWHHEFANRVLAQTEVPGGLVSTVFLGLDHNFSTRGAPLLWETMVFLDGNDVYMTRYSTFDEAKLGHAEIVHRYRDGGVS